MTLVETTTTTAGRPATFVALLGKAIFGLLLFILALAAIPYGTWEPWWKAAVVCLISVVAALAVVEWLLSGARSLSGIKLIAPLLTLAVYAYLQTVQFRSGVVSPSLGLRAWSPISADPYTTRFVAIQLLAMALALALFYRYVNSEKRIWTLVHVILAIAVISALFGLLRQALPKEVGSVLPLTKPDQGYGQFLNKNHFAFMMEMAFGLGLGVVLTGGVRRERLLLYVATLLPIWAALVLSNSRGGVLAMLSQILIGGLVLSSGNLGRRALGISLVASLKKSKLLQLSFALALVVILLFGTLWVGGDRLLGNLESVQSEFNPGNNGLNEGATRNEIWRATLRMFAAHPFFGVGLGGYWVAITSHHDASGVLTPQEAHNDYLELLSSGGIVGFAIGCWFAVVAVQALKRSLQSSTGFEQAVCFGAALGIAGVLVHSLVDYGLHMMANALLFVALLSLASRKALVESEGGPHEA